jgi:hypothetical protein
MRCRDAVRDAECKRQAMRWCRCADVQVSCRCAGAHWCRGACAEVTLVQVCKCAYVQRWCRCRCLGGAEVQVQICSRCAAEQRARCAEVQCRGGTWCGCRETMQRCSIGRSTGEELQSCKVALQSCKDAELQRCRVSTKVQWCRCWRSSGDEVLQR